MSETMDPETARKIKALEAPAELYRGFPEWKVVNAIVRARRNGVLMTAEEWNARGGNRDRRDEETRPPQSRWNMGA